jgi:hypothetical protein
VALADGIDRPAVLGGLRTGLALVVPAGLFSAALADELPTLVKALFVVVIIGGFGSAGAQAARLAERSAVANASVAAALTYVLVQAPLTIVRLARGESANVWTYVFLVLTSMSCGTIGALLVLRNRARNELPES